MVDFLGSKIVDAYKTGNSETNHDQSRLMWDPKPIQLCHQNQQHAHMYDFMHVRTYIRYDIYSWTAGACGAQCAHLIINKNHIRVCICSFCNETIHLSTTPTHQTILSV